MVQWPSTWQKNILRAVYKMKKKISKWRKPALFTIGGAFVGLDYYYFIECSTGSCPITSNPIISMLYMGLMGWLLSCVFRKGCDGKCNM